MAHFARLNSDGIVIDVIVVGDKEMLDENGEESEAVGIAFLDTLFPDETDTWKQTSFNTYQNTHREGKTPLRKNYAAIGYSYDAEKDVFNPPKPFDSWTLNDETGDWEAPTWPRPIGHDWDEENLQWVKPPKPFDSWVWKEEERNEPIVHPIAGWAAPVDPPKTAKPGITHLWDEEQQKWVKQ